MYFLISSEPSNNMAKHGMALIKQQTRTSPSFLNIILFVPFPRMSHCIVPFCNSIFSLFHSSSRQTRSKWSSQSVLTPPATHYAANRSHRTWKRGGERNRQHVTRIQAGVGALGSADKSLFQRYRLASNAGDIRSESG